MQNISLTPLTDPNLDLIQLQSQLVQHHGDFAALRFEHGVFSPVTEGPKEMSAQLVILGQTIQTAQLLALVKLLEGADVQLGYIYSPCEMTLEEDLSEQNKRQLVRIGLCEVPSELKALLRHFCEKAGLDFALLNGIPNLSEPGLVLMDMDSTTIQIECIDEIAKLYGVGEQVSAVTAQAMHGQLDFCESLRSRVALLDGAPESILAEVVEQMPLMPGLKTLLAGLKRAGWKVAIASGGFTYFAQALKKQLGFDAVYASTLEMIDGKLTGKVQGEIVDAKVKARTLNELANQYQLPMSQTVVIGDGANDLLMMAAAAMGVAIHAKPVVQTQAAVSINAYDLEAVLGILNAGQSANWHGSS